MFLKLGKVHIYSFLGAFTVAGIAANAADAQATVTKWTRTHASACMTVGGSPVDSGYAIGNDSTTLGMSVLCDISDDDRFPKTLVKRVNAHVTDGNNDADVSGTIPGRVVLATCRVDAGAAISGSCSAADTSGSTTTGAVMLQRINGDVVFGTASDFVYVYVGLPKKDGTSLSFLRGIYTADASS